MEKNKSDQDEVLLTDSIRTHVFATQKQFFVPGNSDWKRKKINYLILVSVIAKRKK